MPIVEKPTINLLDIVPKQNKDGSVSTVKSMSVGIDGLEYLIPTVIGGKEYSEQEAINLFKKTGNHLGAYSDVDSATASAKMIHNMHDFLVNNQLGQQVFNLIKPLINKSK